MRIESNALPLAARENSRALNSSRPFPGIPAETANPNATARRPNAEIAVNAANAAGKGEKAAVDRPTPEGLMAALARFQAQQSEGGTLNKGQTQAMESINRNIARYQSNLPTPPSATPPTTGSGETATEAADTSVDITV